MRRALIALGIAVLASVPLRAAAAPGGAPAAATTPAPCAAGVSVQIARTPAVAFAQHRAWTAAAAPGCSPAAPASPMAATATPAGPAARAAASAPAAAGPTISTVAGGGIGEGGPLPQSELFLPASLNIDAAGNLYTSIQGRVAELSPSGALSTFAGTGTIGFGPYGSYLGDGGDRLQANFGNGGPAGVASDGHGNTYIADVGDDVVRRIDANGVVSTFAGGGTPGTYGTEGADPRSVFLWGPDGITVDAAGDVYVADGGFCTIREIKASDGKIYTVAGVPGTYFQVAGVRASCGYTADGGPALGSELSQPDDIKIDSKGELIIADTGNCRIRMVDGQGLIHTIAGTGATDASGACADSGDGGAATSGGLAYPWHIFLDGSDNIYAAEHFNQVIRKVSSAGVISTFAGTEGSDGFSGDGGPATQAQLEYPLGVAVDARGNVDIADFGNNRIRQVSADGIIHTIAGNGLPPRTCGSNGCGYFCDGYSGEGLAALHATLSCPGGVAVDATGDVYVADTWNNRVREVDAATGLIRTIAGNGTVADTGDGGPAVNAEVAFPLSLAVSPAGDVYIGEGFHIRRIDRQGIISTFAGGGTSTADGVPATSASLFVVSGMVFDAAGDIYLSESGNNVVRRIDTSGIITTVAGNGTAGFAGDGAGATAAALSYPWGLALDRAGNLYIADSKNERIRRVNAAGNITTIAGNGSGGWNGDGGSATSTALDFPTGVAVDAGGNVFESEPDNCMIREIDPAAGTIHRIAGALPFNPQFTTTSPNFLNCDFGGDGGPASASHLFAPGQMTMGPGGLYFLDAVNERVRLISFEPSAQVPEAPILPLLFALPALLAIAGAHRRPQRFPAFSRARLRTRRCSRRTRACA